ncbi:PP2C family protein-serine/threonine phosphatase [Streptomyces laculatispora]|uniref:PP2C family protein-serine/threonine phosphatase n=1 Tax=Streptomyces laculatispora TaxID=887464 RepID=UPI001A94241F|nr:PP2C family protein-serine/threonine phosphatase [Streptomyces laculatispora]MBO0915393.1 serine/threonine-protein phosphatase [Streptomyces laculatispora]
MTRAGALAELISASHLMPLEQLPDAVASRAALVGWPRVLIYLADLQQERLYLLTARAGADPGDPDAQPSWSVEGTVAGRAFQLGRILPASSTAQGEWWVPLLDGAERLGVLRVGFPGARVEMDEDLNVLAGLVALLLVSKREASDSYSQLVRRRKMKVAAEMEWQLMPPRTFATDRVLVSAIMEPAYQISGDAFDYALADETLHLSIFDAMGHDTAAGLTVNLALAAARNRRRQGAELLQAAEGVGETLTGQFAGRRYVTSLLAELHLPTGVLTWTNYGHHPPFVIRGNRAVVHMSCPPAPPMGTGLGLPGTLRRDQLEPGDRLLLYTDGITEARNQDGQEFGLDRLIDFLVRHHADGLSVPETLRRLIRHHLDYHNGRLNDDATVMLVEWHGPTPFRPHHLKALVGLPPSAENLSSTENL